MFNKATGALRRLAPVPLLLVLFATTARAATAACAPAGATVLRSSASAQIYSSGGALYGCVAGRQRRLGRLTLGPGTRIARYALAGRFAALDTAQMGVDTFNSTVVVYDLRAGAATASAPATSPENRPESFITVQALRVNAAGVAAWVGERSAIGTTPSYELHVLSAHIKNAIIALGTPTRIVALKLTSTEVSYRLQGSSTTHRQAIAPLR